jgi:hypothetical protein
MIGIDFQHMMLILLLSALELPVLEYFSHKKKKEIRQKGK